MLLYENTTSFFDPQGLEDYYKLIDCETIDIVNRDINGNRYDIICDDEGNMTDLSDKDIDFIMENIKRIPTKNYPEGNLMICKMAY